MTNNTYGSIKTTRFPILFGSLLSHLQRSNSIFFWTRTSFLITKQTLFFAYSDFHHGSILISNSRFKTELLQPNWICFRIKGTKITTFEVRCLSRGFPFFLIQGIFTTYLLPHFTISFYLQVWVQMKYNTFCVTS